MPNLLVLLSRLMVDWDVIVLSECWLPCTSFIPPLDGYNFCATVNNKTQNEGVVVYYKKDQDFRITEPNIADSNCLQLEINSDTVLLAIYRPPGQKDTTKFLHSLDANLKELSRYRNIILSGDINIDISDNNSDNNSNTYLNLTASHSMLPAYTIPTHGFTCLDHFLLKTKRATSCYVIHSSVTDHDCIALSMHASSSYVPQPKLIIKKTNCDGVDKDITEFDFSPIYEMSDANMATNYLTNNLKRIIDSNTICVTIPRRKRIKKPWMTQGLLRCIRHRDSLPKK